MAGTATAPTQTPLLALEGVSKRYGPVQAISDVDLDVVPGEVHAIVGENGAGKSTLLKVLAGAIRPDVGEVRFDGETLELGDPREARAHGIASIYQEFTLLPERSIAENVFLGREPRRGWLLDSGALQARTQAVLDELELDLDPTARVGDLPVAGQQMVEIARALSLDTRLLIMDEPTAPLSGAEVAMLHDIVRRLQARGIGIIYVTHRLGEVFAIADRVTVLKDGRKVTTRAATDLDESRLVELMVGRELATYYPPRAEPAELGEVVLRLQSVGVGMLHDVDLEVRRGEIVGLAGLQGAGRTELLQASFGVTPFETGSVELFGRARTLSSPRQAARNRVGFVPEDRKTQALVLEHAVRDNLLLPVRSTDADLDRATEVARAADQVALRGITLDAEVGQASGGNQQKVALGKWLVGGVDLLLLDEPTRGVDVGAKAAVHEVVRDLARQGLAIVMASSELPEIIGMSDRIVVLHEGTSVGELSAGSSETEIMRLATGGR